MKPKLLIIVFVCFLPALCYAQKAYDVAYYHGVLQGKTVKLNLANGYIGAIEIRFAATLGKRPVLYLPDSGVPSQPFVLHSKAKARHDYFTLNNIREVYDKLPRYISGKYYNGKQVIPVKFLLVKH